MNRSILAILLASALARSAPAAEEPWFRRHLVGMEVGPTGAQFGHSDRTDARYCSRFDGAEIVRRVLAAHGEYLVIWARDGDYAYYQSRLLPRAPGLSDRDPLREAVEAARSHRMPVIAYCVVQQGGHYLKEHPEWEMRGADGKPLGRFCLNSGYLEGMKAIVAEQLAYGIDGFHIDMLDQGFGPPYGCWCPTCRDRFRAEFDREMPPGATWDDAWDDMLTFRYRSSERFEKELAAHVKSLNPKATVDFNYHGNPPFSFEVGQRPVQHAGNSDFVTGETGVWGFSALGVGLNARFYRAATPGLPYQVAIQRGVRMYHDQTTRPLNDIRWELLTLLAHGAFVTMVDKTGLDGSLDPVAYDRIGTAFEEARAKRAHFGQEPVQEVGLYFSSRTRDWIGREDPARVFQSFQGAHKACVYEHIPFGVILDENATPETLRSFPVVCLPNAAILSTEEVAMLRGYVEGGGNLIVTGQGGQFDRLGRPLAESTLAGLVGARAVGRLESQDNWVRVGSGGSSDFAPLIDEIPHAGRSGKPDGAGTPFLVKGPATIYEPTTARPFGELIRPHRTTRQAEGKEGTDWPMSPDAPVGPAILIHRVGAGTVLTFAGSPDFATAGEHHVVEARKLFRNAVRYLNPTPRVEIHAPANVEAVVTDDRASRTLRVHLLGYFAPPQTTPAKGRPFILPALLEDLPMYRVRIKPAVKVTGARALSDSAKLTRSGREIVAVVEDLHEIILIDYE